MMNTVWSGGLVCPCCLSFPQRSGCGPGQGGRSADTGKITLRRGPRGPGGGGTIETDSVRRCLLGLGNPRTGSTTLPATKARAGEAQGRGHPPPWRKLPGRKSRRRQAFTSMCTLKSTITRRKLNYSAERTVYDFDLKKE